MLLLLAADEVIWSVHLKYPVLGAKIRITELRSGFITGRQN